MDFVLTVCDNAAGEACPLWPGQPITAHWGIEDPAAVDGSDIDKERAFVTAFRYLRNRISLLVNLPVASLNRLALTRHLQDIGRIEGSTVAESEGRMRRAAASPAEALGTGLLLATVIGSGIMGERLAGGNVAIALLGNTLADRRDPGGADHDARPDLGRALQSGSERRVRAQEGDCRRATLAAYVLAQIAGGIAGVLIAHGMFDETLLPVSTKARSGPAQWLSEAVAAFGLVLTILLTLRANPAAVAASVGLYITAAYWFTASTSFANPAVTIARALSDTFAGIRPCRCGALHCSPTRGRDSCHVFWPLAYP